MIEIFISTWRLNEYGTCSVETFLMVLNSRKPLFSPPHQIFQQSTSNIQQPTSNGNRTLNHLELV
jgi:hypothetical protein